MKKALCVGINNYPGTSNDHNGCVNDANDWSALLQDYGFSVDILLDSKATRQNIKNALSDLVNQTNFMRNYENYFPRGNIHRHRNWKEQAPINKHRCLSRL